MTTRYAFKFFTRHIVDGRVVYRNTFVLTDPLAPSVMRGTTLPPYIETPLHLCRVGYHACLTLKQLGRWYAQGTVFLVELHDYDPRQRSPKKGVARCYRVLGSLGPLRHYQRRVPEDVRLARLRPRVAAILRKQGRSNERARAYRELGLGPVRAV